MRFKKIEELHGIERRKVKEESTSQKNGKTCEAVRAGVIFLIKHISIMEDGKMTKKVLFTLVIVLLILAVPALAQEGNYGLTWGSRTGMSGPGNPVHVVWNGSTAELSVTYTNGGNYFALNNINEAQGSKLLRADASGNLREVSGVTSRIVSTGNTRGGSNYGTVVLKFFSGSAPYIFQGGTSYGVQFDIIANGYHHATPASTNPFRFTVSTQ